MKWCQPCNQYYYDGQVCPQCGSYLYDAPDQYSQPASYQYPQMDGYQFPQMDGYTVQYYPPQMMQQGGGKAPVILGMIAVVLAIALGICIYLLVQGPEDTPPEVEAAVLQSGYDWYEEVYGSLDAYITLHTAAADQNLSSSLEISEEALSSIGESYGELAGQAVALGIYTSDDYKSMISSPIQAMGDKYPEIAGAWERVANYYINLQAPGNIEDFAVVGRDYKEAVEAAGFDVSSW